MDTDKTQTDDDERLWDALARWEESYQQGHDLPADEFCRNCPDILDQLKERIWALKRTTWMTKPTADESDAEPQDVSDQTPKTLGEYTILERIGAGGMGAVFKALHRRMERTVVLKLLPRSSPEAAQRFQDEVKAAAKLVHPNIVTAFDAGESDGIPFLVMEFTEGVDLHRHVQQHGPLPVQEATAYVLQAARGLEFAHSKGIIHRDIKPANLLLGSDGTVKILDMGLAQIRAAQPQAAVGTPDFMAPELAIHPSNADPRTDIYSLGCTLFFLLTGKPLFDGSTVIQKILAHRDQPAPSLRKVRSDVPDALDAVFQRMVAKRPADRYQSTADVVVALREGVQTKRSRLLWIGTAAAVIAGLLLAGYSVHSQKEPDKAAFEPDTTQDRKAAEWVLNIGGKVTVEPRNGEQVAVTDLAGLPTKPFKVKSIDLHGNSRVTDDALAVLKGLDQITNLNLTKTRITDPGTGSLRDLKSLQSLRLNETSITDRGLQNLEGLTKLNMLELWGTHISNDGLKHLAKMQDLTWLILTNTKITDDGLSHLRALPNLRDLRLARLRVTDEGVKNLAALKELRTLELYETDVTDAALKSIASLTNLTWLNLVRTKISDAGVDDLTTLKNLRQLNVDGTKVSRSGIQRLRQAILNCKITPGD